MSSRYFDDHQFDLAIARQELTEFKALLDANGPLSERAQVLANFKNWSHLCSLFGEYHPLIKTADLIKRELTIGANFRADLGVRLDGTANVCLIEFEGASENDIFKKGSATRIAPWATPMEKGFSQIVDWAWALDTHRGLPEFEDAFGSRRPNVAAVLVIGRSSSLTNSTNKDRWEWRSGWAKFSHIQGVHLQTYDELHRFFDIQLKLKAGSAK